MTTDGELPLYQGTTGGIVKGSGVLLSTLRKQSPANFYIATAANGGSDSNDGLAATVGGGHGPWLTGQHAVNSIYSGYDGEGQLFIVNVGVGTFDWTVALGGNTGGAGSSAGAAIIFLGAGKTLTFIAPSTPGNFFAHAFTVAAHATLGLGSMTVSTAIAGGSALFVQNHALAYIYDANVSFGAIASGQHIHVEGHGMFELPGGYGYEISGAAASHYGIAQMGYIELDPGTRQITITGAFGFPNGFALLQDNSVLGIGQNLTYNWSGVTGPRYVLQGTSTLHILGATASTILTYLPGSLVPQVSIGSYAYPQAQPTLANIVGVGTGGTAALTPNSTNRAGTVVFTSGSASTGAALAADVTLTELPFNGEPRVVISKGPGWGDPATAMISAQITGTPAVFTLRGATNGAAVATASSFSISYHVEF